MRFAYIDGEEFESIAEAAVKLPEVPKLARKGGQV
jgi:hypothetical protein